MNFPITVHPEALKQIQRILKRKGGTNSFFRLGVKGGGCSGLEYLFKVDDSLNDNDLQIELEETKIVCDSKSARFLEGSELIYTGNLMHGGFQYKNPNAKRSCGCGVSFTPKI